MSGPPLVSCVMPTRDRRRFVAQAIWYFLRQDHPARELLVLDDGDAAVADLVPSDDRIRYVRLDGRRTLGGKHRLASELARGELIAHWHDDDWIGPDRLRSQLAALGELGGDGCAARCELRYHVTGGAAWLHRPPGGLVPGTLLYRRELARRHPLPDGDVAGWRGCERLRALPEAPWHIGLLYGRPAGGAWERRPLTEVAARIGSDRAFYVGLRDGRPARRTGRAAGARVTVAAPFMVYDGYGSMAEYLVRGLARAGSGVDVVPIGIDPAGLSEEFRAIHAASRPEPGAPVLYFCWPRAELDRFRGAEVFVNTMWESSRLPARWRGRLDRARAVIVPTRFVARVLAAGGVTAPIEVIPEGVDPAVYHLEPREERESLTTLIVATAIERKNVGVGIEAWRRAFAGDASARLLLKSRFACRESLGGDPRIEVVDEAEPTRGIAHWYRRADVLLALGSEGFGLPLVEGMATGLPVVALASEGQADTCAAAGDRVLAVPPRSWSESDATHFGPSGMHGVPGVEDVAAHLRWVDGHRDEARALGRAAAEWVPRHRNVWDKAPAVLDVMERRVRPRRPLRRAETLWVPSWGGACGIAEYAARVAAELPDVRVVRDAPDLRGVRVLHVEHEPSLFEENALSARIAEAVALGIPVTVNEHAVGTQAHAWERDASLLTALTAAGAARLRERWPAVRVEHVPHGCSTWFPPRKPRRGRVIGAFGFLEPHKGFGRLLEALPRLPGAELVLYSHAKDPALGREFDAAAAGLPARRVDAFLPEREVVRRLAAEADALAFWYEPTATASSSGAVRVALSTGVPVLTSCAGCLDELGEATYRPDDLGQGLARLLDDDDLSARLRSAAQEYCHEHSWARMAARHRRLWRAIDRR